MLPYLIKPNILPPLDADFRPASLANRQFRLKVDECGQAAQLVICLERADGSISRNESIIFPEGYPAFIKNFYYVERLVKFLLWQYGAWRIFIGGSTVIADHLKKLYSPAGERKFDYHFMSSIYEQDFTIVSCKVEETPKANETSHPLGRQTDGCRIGFDLGASDLKVSSIIDGEVVFSTEIEWQPRLQADPLYHKKHLRQAIQLAASNLPHVDAIGGSSAGVIIRNRPMIASILKSIPPERMAEAQELFTEIGNEMGVPIEVANDGDIAALAGSMSIDDNRVLGIALGSSQAAGYVNANGEITNWLNELAFAPIDFNPSAPIDEWSGDRGVGAKYFSQQCVFRLAPKAGIKIPSDLSDAQKLKFIQKKLDAGDPAAQKIWQSMGYYLGYGLASYADFYDFDHVLILGRCTSGQGGSIILEAASQVLKNEFPQLAQSIHIHLPDEKNRRVGQSIAAASLPRLYRR